MLKHIDDIRKSARERAQRRWQNYATEKAFKAARQEAAEKATQQAKQPKEPEPADVLEQDRLIKEGTTKFESKFLKDIRAMLDEHYGAQLGIVCAVNSSAAVQITQRKAKASGIA